MLKRGLRDTDDYKASRELQKISFDNLLFNRRTLDSHVNYIKLENYKLKKNLLCKNGSAQIMI
jgi:hypothetical protein